VKFYNEYIRLYRYFIFPERNKAADNLILYIETYVNMATIQLQRMQENSNEAIQLTKNNEPDSMEKRIVYSRMTGDEHFFLNCIDKVYQLSKRLAEQVLKDKPLIEMVKSCQDQQYYRDARNHFEHMEERLVETNWFRSPTFNNIKILDGVGYPLDERSLIPLYSMYEQLIKRIDEIYEPMKDQIDKYFGL
jgi:hypothetical protein